MDFATIIKNIALINSNVETIAKVNDITDRGTALVATAGNFARELIGVVKADKGTEDFDFFMKRWFFVESMNRNKTVVYETIIKALMEALNKSLMESGRTYSMLMLEQQFPSYSQLDRLEKNETFSISHFSSKLNGKLSSFTKSLTDLMHVKPIGQPTEIVTKDIATDHAKLSCDEVLQFPYERKLEILKRCLPNKYAKNWNKSCRATAEMKQPGLKDGKASNDLYSAELLRILDQIEHAPRQLDKNYLLDFAIEQAYPSLPVKKKSLFGFGGKRIRKNNNRTRKNKNINKNIKTR
jgi:hypothetical protein